MATYRIRRGLDLPIQGGPLQIIEPGNPVTTVALKGPDYIGMRPTMLVQVGDRVKTGTPLFEDKKNIQVRYTSPGAGEVVAIHRGDKRAFLSVVIRLEGNDEETFEVISETQILSVDSEKLKSVMVASGIWTALRARPFSKVPEPDTKPQSIFVRAVDTRPLAPRPKMYIGEQPQAFRNGVLALTRLAPKVHVCLGEVTTIPEIEHPSVEIHRFLGPHPAGLVGTHIHMVDPVNAKRTVWHIGYQDVIALGQLLATGRTWTERVVSIAGPQVKTPRLVRTRLGACLSELLKGELKEGENRVISGSVLAGTHAPAGDPADFLGRYHNQVGVLRENRERELLGWQKPGLDVFSTKNVFASKIFDLFGGKRYAFTTTTNGSKRAMVPIGMYENVMPLDMIPTYLLRSLLSNDAEAALKLGVLELDEEDLSLCTFVDPGKTEFGPLLREMLTTIEKEG